MWQYMSRIFDFQPTPPSPPPTARTPLLAKQREYAQPEISVSSPQLAPSGPTPTNCNGSRDVFESLRLYHTIFIVDDSYTMSPSLWTLVYQVLGEFAEIADQFYPEGINIYFAKSQQAGVKMRSKAEVERLFRSVRPTGRAPIGEKLRLILELYTECLELNRRARIPPPPPVNFIVIIGSPASAGMGIDLTQLARALDKERFPISQIGIQFIQVGDDPDTLVNLKVLDKELKDSCDSRDMVDIVPYSENLTCGLIMKTLSHNVNKRINSR